MLGSEPGFARSAYPGEGRVSNSVHQSHCLKRIGTAFRGSVARKRTGYSIAITIAFCCLLTACGANADPILPTTRPTVTLTAVPSTTDTPPFIPSPTDLPTAIPLPVTPTAGPSPTALIGSTSTRPAPPTATPTSKLVQAGSLLIEYFTTDAAAVRPGDQLTLFWSVKGADRALIYRLNADGSHDFTWQVGSAGTLVVTTSPKDKDKDVSRFSISIGDNMTRIEQTLSVPVKCATESWFFEPAPDSCPADAPLNSPAASQVFERGQMIWLSSQSRIYVLFNDGKKPAWIAYTDEFKDGQPERDNSLSPPPGLAQPIRGFGLVWRTKEKVRERLGWATGPETGYEGVFQSDDLAVPDNTIYLQGRDKVVFQLSSQGSAWKLLTPTK